MQTTLTAACCLFTLASTQYSTPNSLHHRPQNCLSSTHSCGLCDVTTVSTCLYHHRKLDFDVVVANSHSLRSIVIKNTTHTRLTLGVATSRPEFTLYVQNSQVMADLAELRRRSTRKEGQRDAFADSLEQRGYMHLHIISLLH